MKTRSLSAFAAPLAALALASCSLSRADEYALVAAKQNATLTTARNEEFRAFVMATDSRERAALERELDLVAQLGERDIDVAFASELDKATVGAFTDSRAESRPFVAPKDVLRIVARQNADRAAVRAAIQAKRTAITAKLDAELKAWLDDPKARQQDRIAAAMAAYADERAEFSRFMNSIGAKLGVSSSPETSP